MVITITMMMHDDDNAGRHDGGGVNVCMADFALSSP